MNGKAKPRPKSGRTINEGLGRTKKPEISLPDNIDDDTDGMIEALFKMRRDWKKLIGVILAQQKEIAELKKKRK